MKNNRFNTTYTRLGSLAGVVLLAAIAQPASASLFGSDYAQESIGAYKGLPEDTLRYMGGPQGVSTTIDAFYAEAKNDNRINGLMYGATPEQVRAQKAAMVQTLLGTPSIAAGTTQGGIHQLTITQYNALVEDLYLAMETTRVSYTVQNSVMGSLSAFTPAFVSAYVLAEPSVDQGGLNDKTGVVQVGRPGI